MKDKKLTWPQRGRLWLRLGLRLVLALLALWLLRAVGLPLLSLCAPFVAALITAALLHPPVQWLQKRLHWRRKLSSLLILLLLFGLMGGGIGYLGYAAGAELVSLVQNWEGLLEGLRTVLDQLELISFQLWTLVPPELTESVQSVADGLMDWLNTAVPNILQNAVAFTTEKAKRVPSFGLALIIYVMAAYMLTVDYPELRARAAQHTHERLLRFVVQVRNIALAAFGGYLRAELLLSVGVFFILLVGFFLIGTVLRPAAGLWGWPCWTSSPSWGQGRSWCPGPFWPCSPMITLRPSRSC